MPVPQGQITSSQIFVAKDGKKDGKNKYKVELTLIMMAGGYGENKAGEILKLVLKDVKLSRKTMKEFVPLVEPDWSGILVGISNDVFRLQGGW
jgi:hypothetical protein